MCEPIAAVMTSACGAHQPAVERHFITAEMEIGVGKHLRHLLEEGPEQLVSFVAHGVDGPFGAETAAIVIVAVCQQIRIPSSPGQRVACAIAQFLRSP